MEIKREKRGSALELLRIISMILIVAHHFSVHSAFSDVSSGFNRFIIQMFQSGGKVAVNVFVLISGYFLVQSGFKIRRVINVVVPTVIYSVLCYVTVSLCKGISITGTQLLWAFMPIRNNGYWFVTCFVALSVLTPFINKMIHALDEKQHLLLIAILVVMQVAVSKINPMFSISNVGWFITLYIIGGYVRKYPSKILSSRLYMGLAVGVLGTVAIIFPHATRVNDIVCLALSVALLCLFKDVNIGQHRCINLVGKATFGVYLIHDNRYVRPVLWNEVLSCPQHASLGTFWLFAIVSVATVFVASVAIDLVRMLITRQIARLLEKIIEKRKNQTSHSEKAT